MTAERIIREKDLGEYDALSRVTRRQLVKKGLYPAPIRLTDYRIGWRMSEVQDWIEARTRATRESDHASSPAA